MPINRILVDANGRCEKGYFYEFSVPFSEEDTAKGIKDRSTIVAPGLVSGKPGWSDKVWVDDVGEMKDQVNEYGCTASKKHPTTTYWTNITGDVSGGRMVMPFVPTTTGFGFVVQPSVADRLRTLDISGLRIDPLDIVTNQSDVAKLSLYTMQCLGRGVRERVRFVGTDDRCPFCKKGMPYCVECGFWPGKCEVCGKFMVTAEEFHKGSDDLRWTSDRFDTVPVLDVSRWDVADFVDVSGRKMVSKRVIEFLLSIHAGPFVAKPVLVYLDNLSDVLRRKLEAIRRPFES